MFSRRQKENGIEDPKEGVGLRKGQSIEMEEGNQSSDPSSLVDVVVRIGLSLMQSEVIFLVKKEAKSSTKSEDGRSS